MQFKPGEKSHYDLWKVDEIEHWIQIEQIQFNLRILTNHLFPGYIPMTEDGKRWKSRAHPLMCIMTPDFESMSDRNKLRKWHDRIQRLEQRSLLDNWAMCFRTAKGKTKNRWKRRNRTSQINNVIGILWTNQVLQRFVLVLLMTVSMVFCSLLWKGVTEQRKS